MTQPRRYPIDFLGLTVLGTAILLTLCVASYNQADPVGEPIYPLNQIYQPDLLSFPAATEVSNLCGPMGALVADLLFRCCGGAAYFVVLSLYALAFVMMRTEAVTGPCIRLGGWLVALLGLSTLLSIWQGQQWSGPIIGPGGYLGALGQFFLTERLGTLAASFVGMFAIAGGMLLTSNFVLQRITALTVGRVAGKTEKAAKRRRKAVADDLVEEDLSIRIGRKRGLIDEPEAEEDEELEEDAAEGEWAEGDEEWEEDEYEDEEQEVDEDEVEEDEELAAAASQEGALRKTAATAASGLRRLMQRTLPTPGGDTSAPPAPHFDTSASATTDDAEELSVEPETETVAKFKPSKGKKVDRRLEVMEQLDEASRNDEPMNYDLPSIELLRAGDDFCHDEQEKEVRRKAKILERTFKSFGLNVKVVEIETGPVIGQYEIELEPGLRLSKVTGLADDVAIALRVPSVRIVAPIPGKNTVGIEVPNADRQVVRLREVMEEASSRVKKMRIPLFLGKDVSGNPLTADLSTLPHLLIAGRTGTGKSVCLNAIISSILMTRRPDEVRMLMIDPKMVELSGYKTLPHLMHPVVTDMGKAEAILAWAVDKMEERYALLAQAGVRHISGYNQLGEEELLDRLEANDGDLEDVPTHLPYIVIVADEMADLMMTARKEVEQHIIRLAQKSRAVGIHLILATQKPTVDVITGLIKSNLPARIAFQVASRTDSRVVLDEMGADKLLGNGDMLFLWPGTSTLLRGQGTYLSDEEINSIVEAVSTGEQDFVSELVQLQVEPAGEGGETPTLKNRDDLYESAVDVVVREGRGSCSLLQRCLGIGYGRAARLIDFMAEDGIVGPYNGSQAREVVISIADWEAMQAGEAPPTESVTESAPSKPAPKPKPEKQPKASEPATARKRRSNKIIPIGDWSDDEAGGESKSSKPKRAAKQTVPEDEVEYEDDEVDELEDDELEDDAEEDDAEQEDGEEVDEYEEDEYEEEEYEDEEYEEAELEDGEEEIAPEEAAEHEEEDEDFDGEEYEDEEYEAERA